MLHKKLSKEKLSEYAVVQRIVTHLKNLGYRVRTEVPNMGQSVDLVATRNRWVTFIEAKMHDWRRALVQCQAHEQVADFICIAIGTVSVSESLTAQVKDVGYGLIHCPPGDEKCEWIVKPKQNMNVWEPQRNRLAEALRAIDHEN